MDVTFTVRTREDAMAAIRLLQQYLGENVVTGVPIEKLYKYGLTMRSRKVLEDLGVTTIGELQSIPESALLKLPSCGRLSAKEIREAVDMYVASQNKSS